MDNANYTIRLKTLMEDERGSQLLKEAMSDYPLYVKKSKEEFIPSYIPTREELNQVILNHFKYREIGFETPARFFDELKITMREIMPYYNLMFFSADQDFNVIYNVDYVRENNAEVDGNSNVSTNQSSSATSKSDNSSSSKSSGTDSSNSDTSMKDKSKNVHSDTPQSKLNLSNDDINSVQYADNASWNKHDSESATNTNGSTSSATDSNSSVNTSSNDSLTSSNIATNKNTSKSTETIKGNFGVVSAQHLILKYRETIVNIEQMIINDPRLQELFMLVY